MSVSKKIAFGSLMGASHHGFLCGKRLGSYCLFRKRLLAR